MNTHTNSVKSSAGVVMTEDDTFNKLRRPPFMVVYQRVDIALCEYLSGQGPFWHLTSIVDVMDKVITDNHWDIEEYKAITREM